MKECQLCKNCYTDDVKSCPKDGMLTMHTISGEPVLEGKYHLECRLGQGGMGVVYKARHAYLKTQHAIKIILPDLVGNDPQLLTRFRQEALAAAAIRHQNVVGVSDYGVANGTMPFLVMEFVEGESLHDLLAREKQLSPERALDLMSAICAGVGAAHEQGIVHRDLKPLNVMLCKDKPKMSDAIKILDFGLAKIKSGELLGSFIQAQTTGLMGSPYYMAPEQWSDEEPDARSDIYSLGIMLYQMLAGDVPFKGTSIPAIMKKHLADGVPQLGDFGVNVSPQIELAVRHALEKDQEKRTQTVEQLVKELRNALLSTSTGNYASGYLSNSALPVSSLRILTNPAQSNVFIDGFAAGKSRPDGWLLLEGVHNGNHQLCVKNEGYFDFEQNFACNGGSVELFAELKKDIGAIPKPVLNTMPMVQLPSSLTSDTPSNLSATQNFQPQTTGQIQPEVQSAFTNAEPKKPAFSPLVLTIIGISGLFLLTAIGVGSAYFLGYFSGSDIQTGNASPTPKVSPSVIQNEKIQAEMIKISGGEFMMGRDDGEPFEKPAHSVEVEDFSMDKFEVTNAEFYQFVSENSYKFNSNDWVDGKPPKEKEKMPVRFVNIEDIEEFIKWRSKRDNVSYQLPTEDQWEFAARNGSKETLYPWGNEYREECGVLGKATAEVEDVGSKECGANDAGVYDLIGNVFEWTQSEAKAYPGNSGEIKGKPGVKYFVVRGGSSYRDQKGKIAETATFRLPVPSDSRDNRIGFRLVSSP
ncbi:hypothetical protein BH10ACI1_BH10ACI1_26910 [soil metagenome]